MDPPLRECLIALVEGAEFPRDVIARLDIDEDIVLDRCSALVRLGLAERAM
jgi:hypothetical protein